MLNKSTIPACLEHYTVIPHHDPAIYRAGCDPPARHE
jgi:hypothetical protein